MEIILEVVLLVVLLNIKYNHPEIKMIKIKKKIKKIAPLSYDLSWWLLRLLTFIPAVCISLTIRTFLCKENFSHSRDYGIYQDNVNCCGKKIFNKETEKLSGLSIC